MPTYTYTCPECRCAKDEFFVNYKDSLDTMVCFCGGTMGKDTVYTFKLVGPVFHDLMQIEETLLGKQALKAGKRLRGKRDIERWERENGLVRCTAKEEREGHEYYCDTRSEQSEILARAGQDGWFEHVNRGDIKDITGWSESQYLRWRNMNNAEQTRINSGTAPTSPETT